MRGIIGHMSGVLALAGIVWIVVGGLLVAPAVQHVEELEMLEAGLILMSAGFLLQGIALADDCRHYVRFHLLGETEEGEDEKTANEHVSQPSQ